MEGAMDVSDIAEKAPTFDRPQWTEAKWGLSGGPALDSLEPSMALRGLDAACFSLLRTLGLHAAAAEGDVSA